MDAPVPNRDREGAGLPAEDIRLIEAVNRGEFLTHEQAGKRLERFLKP